MTLTVACADPSFAREFRQRAVGWAGRTGATVAVGPDAAADLAIIPPADLGAFASRGELATLPNEYIQPSNPLQWNAILPVYGRTLSGWGEKLVGLPLAGDGAVLVYRADRLSDARSRSEFRAKTGRDLGPPATWDDLADLAAFFHDRDGRSPSLAPLPADTDRLATLFFRIAASADRKPVAIGTGGSSGEAALGFLFDPTTGSPRLTTPAFAAAAGWLARTQKFRPAAPSDDAVAALDTGGAVAAVLTLADVSRLPRDDTGAVAKWFGVAKLPGSRAVFGPTGTREDAPAAGNYIPYLGTRAKVGVVFARSKAAAAAWDLLADAASVSGGLAAMGHPALGVGPYRAEQVEEARSSVWLQYGFDPAGTRALGDAVRHGLGLDVGNPTTVLRVPDQTELTAALAKHLQRAAAAEASPADAMAAAAAEWEQIAATPGFKGWVRAAAGLQ